MAQILKGAPVADALTEQLKAKADALKAKGITPTLAILRMGENDSDLSYERGAMKRCEKIGIAVKQIILDVNCCQAELMAEIEKINNDKGIHGCLMFRPLPKHIEERVVCEALAPEKDVDCITSGSLYTVLVGKGGGFAPCTAQSCIEILEYYGVDLTGKRVAVIGRSLVIGKPVSLMLQAKNATVTMCHTKTVDMPDVCREAEILIVAAGHANTVDWTYVHPNQIVIDVGINTDAAGKLCGDVDFDAVEPHVKAITPVPGGVGSVTTAVLCKHVIEAAERASI